MKISDWNFSGEVKFFNASRNFSADVSQTFDTNNVSSSVMIEGVNVDDALSKKSPTAVSAIHTSGRTGVACSVRTESVSSRIAEVSIALQPVGGLTGGGAKQEVLTR